ncbi:LOW QUALITY PROTEIN: Protein CBR-LIN-15B, partial [Caenorhabditis briggsae]
PPPYKASGILRHRPPPAARAEEQQQLETDPKTVELLARFLVSQGLPLECSKEPAFLDLARHLNSRMVIPPENVMNKFIDRAAQIAKPLVNFQKTVGPLTVTLDIAGDDDQKYLVFSIHYFEDLYERKNIVYLRKMYLRFIEAETLLTSIRRAVNNYTYGTVKFSNIVCPNESILEMISNSGVVKRYYVCFQNYMTQFVHILLKIPELAQGLNQIRCFVKYIRQDADKYSRFRRMQLSRSAEMDVPKLDKESWESTSVFLTRCLVLHDTFVEYCQLMNLDPYISNKTFNHLIYFQRLLEQCIKYSRELSQSNNSMSQVLPAIISLKGYITTNNLGYPFQRQIDETAEKIFGPITYGDSRGLYEIASLLDPRYAYGDCFPMEQWKMLEKRVIQEFVGADQRLEKCFYHDITLMSNTERMKVLGKEFTLYRHCAFVERPLESESPFFWWGRRQTDMEFLSVIAREYIACPATSIDSTAFFNEGGKFNYLCNTYSYSQLDSCLNVAGIHQHYRGRGPTSEPISPEMVETLNSTANRLQQTTLYALTEQEAAEITAGFYPPMPTYANQEEKVFEKLPPHRRTVNRIPNSVPNPIPIRKVPLQRMVPGGRPSILRSTLPPSRTLGLPLTAKRPVVPRESPPGNVVTEEKPRDLLDILQEPSQEKEIKLEEPDDFWDSAPSGPSTSAASAPSTSTQPSTYQTSLKGIPQKIATHNFVQKFAQKQNFIIKKKPLPPPISIRANMPRIQQEYKPELFNVGDRERILARERFQMAFQPQETVYSQTMNAASVADAYERKNMKSSLNPKCSRHRINVEMVKSRPCNRRCTVCGHLEVHEKLKNVTIDNEKLLIMLGCIYRQEYTLREAISFMNRESKTYICLMHFEETVDEIYTMLRLSCPDDINTCSDDLIQNALITVTALRPFIQIKQLRKILFDFTLKNNHTRATMTVSRLDECIRRRSPAAPKTDNLDDQEITPKVNRAPRKQVLEEDQHDKTVKLIEQEEFKLPTVQQSDNEECANPTVCCYCSKRGSRLKMHRVPRTEDRLQRWIEKLGSVFEKRLKAEEDNFVCKSHFPEDAFSSRGRLMKGMIPFSEAEKKEVTYKIQGDSFLKLNEQKS